MQLFRKIAYGSNSRRRNLILCSTDHIRVVFIVYVRFNVLVWYTDKGIQQKTQGVIIMKKDDVIKVLQQVCDICGATKYCTNCVMYNDNIGECIFADRPYLWNFEKLEEVLKGSK